MDIARCLKKGRQDLMVRAPFIVSGYYLCRNQLENALKDGINAVNYKVEEWWIT